jgi:hypothetical protein
VFYDFTRAEKNPDNFFLFMLKKYTELIEKVSIAKKIEAAMAFNSFPPPFFIDFPNLFKFSYFKWLYQEIGTSQTESYSEIILPSEAIVFQRKMRENLTQKRNTVLILDMDIFMNLIKEIQYFYQRRLLTDEELLLLKEDTVRLIEQYEKIAQSGLFGSSKVQLYLSSLVVNSNTICYKYDDKTEPLFWIFTVNPVIIQNSGFIAMQIKWLNSLKRQSALITQSNEIMQAAFFSQQREYIDQYLSIEDFM